MYPSVHLDGASIGTQYDRARDFHLQHDDQLEDIMNWSSSPRSIMMPIRRRPISARTEEISTQAIESICQHVLLILENQNSSSPKTRTPKRLIVKTGISSE